MALQKVVTQFMPHGEALKSLASYRSRVENAHLFARKYYAATDTVNVGRLRFNVNFDFLGNLKRIDWE